MPGFKTFTSATLSSADVNDYLMEQAVIQCTSGTRPSSPHEGMTIYETDTNAIKCYSGSAWETVLYPIDGWVTSFSPRATQDNEASTPSSHGGLLSVTVTSSRYRKVGRSLKWTAVITLNSGMNAKASNRVLVELPASASWVVGKIIGTGYIYDASANTTHKGLAYLFAVDAISFLPTANSSPNALGVSDFTAELAASDAIVIDVEFETTS